MVKQLLERKEENMHLCSKNELAELKQSGVEICARSDFSM